MGQKTTFVIYLIRTITMGKLVIVLFVVNAAIWFMPPHSIGVSIEVASVEEPVVLDETISVTLSTE